MKTQDKPVFRKIFRRMMALMSLTILVAAIGAGVGAHEVGIVVVLFCLWVALMLVAIISKRWIARRF